MVDFGVMVRKLVVCGVVFNKYQEVSPEIFAGNFPRKFSQEPESMDRSEKRTGP
jgi:hypothetical protein